MSLTGSYYPHSSILYFLPWCFQATLHNPQTSAQHRCNFHISQQNAELVTRAWALQDFVSKFICNLQETTIHETHSYEYAICMEATPARHIQEMQIPVHSYTKQNQVLMLRFPDL